MVRLCPAPEHAGPSLTKIAAKGRDGGLAAPASAALLDRVRRSLAKLVALRAAGAALDAARPGAMRDLAALAHEPAIHRAMTEMQGRARTARLIAEIERETRVRQDPSLQAERLVRERDVARVLDRGLRQDRGRSR
jgi:hypothetical protein